MSSLSDSLAQANQQLPEYTFLERIYQGTRTTVYRARAATTQQLVVVKVLSQAYPSFGQLVQFRNQYTVAKNLPITGIVRPLDLVPWSHGYALVMEDIGGIDLGRYAQQHALSLTEILNIAIQLAAILYQLHQSRVIHKDIKPANILIRPESQQVKLIDFSLASRLPKETQAIQSPRLLEGTLAYLAPEQTGRMNRAVDYRSDFYTLGVTLYELLTGQLPFQVDDPIELVHCHLAKQAIAPAALNPDIPATVSDIVLKLMAKNAEDRYRSALGLHYDLEQCLHQWQQTGTITPFELGSRDLSDRFLIPEKLYGREAEVTALLTAFNRVSAGSSELMLVAGYSGVGKTAVVNEVHKPITRQRGYFIKGKFDQLNRNMPFSAFVQAFRSLMEQLLGESDTALAAWKAKILVAVGENGQVLIDVIPELKHIISEQPAVPELSGNAAQNRFNLLFNQFIRVFTTANHPLVIFLDDLQWVDAASLSLFKLLMEDGSGHLLMLGAYRDNEVFPAHPLMLMLDDLRQQQRTVSTLTLEPLRTEDVNYLVADSLHCSVDIAQPLAQLVYQKTGGNPFFATQFLQGLYSDGWITFDAEVGYWQCDLTQVRQSALTEDVVKFMVGRIQKLPEATQTVLKIAACMGNQFDLATLAVVCEQSQAAVAANLWRSLQVGLVIPENETYKFFQETTPDKPPGKDMASITVGYQFLHDRVQQAAYSLIPEAQRQATHFHIGHLLLNSFSGVAQAERLFEIVGHLNLGRTFVVHPAERSELVRLNLQAAQKARLATAYSAAVEYLTVGIELLTPESWQQDYDLTLTLHVEMTEVLYLKTDFERMEQWADRVLHQAETLLDTIKVQQARIMGAKAQGHLRDAIAIGLQVLQALGIEIPAQPTPDDIDQAFAVTRTLWADKPPLSLLELPAMTDPLLLAAMEILTVLVPAAYMAAPTLMPLLILKQVELSIQSGNSPVSIVSYADYGLIVSNMMGDRKNGYEFGELALKLLEKLQTKPFKSRSWYVVHTYIKHWKNSLSEMLQPLQEAYASGLETGDIESLSLNAFVYCAYAYHAGQNLTDLAQTLEAYRQTISQYRQAFCLSFHEIYQQTVLNLLGQTDIPDELTGEIFDREVLLPQLQATNQRTALFLWYLNQFILAYLFEKHDAAIQLSAQVSAYLDGGTGQFMTCLYPFFDALTQLTQFAEITADERQTVLLKVQRHQAQLQDWATLAPSNHQHRWELVEAERCRVMERWADAIAYYDRAIADAKANGFIQDEALANELAAKFYLTWGKEKVAAGYLQEAYYSYSRWGARAKVADLENRYPNLLRPILQPFVASADVLNALTSIAGPKIVSHGGARPSTRLNQTFDLASVLQASQALTSTLQLDELMRQLTQIILQYSGSDRCALILPDRHHHWQLQAIATPDGTDLCKEPLEGHLSLPTQLIQYVKNTQAAVVINDLKTNLPVLDDYLLQQRPKSVLALPVLNQSKLIGVLYLSNQATSEIFTNDRILILNFLCAQAAISLENARLFAEQQQAEADLQHKNVFLKAQQESSLDGMLVIDANRRVSAYNQRFVTIWKIPETILATQDDRQLLDYVLDQLEDPAEFLAKVEYLYEHPDESSHDELALKDQRFLERYSSPVKLPSGEYDSRIWYFRDISDRKAYEEHLQQTNAELIRATRLKDEFLATMSHELRTPLNAVLGMTENLQEEIFGAINPQQLEALNLIEQSSTHLLLLINDILDLSKITAEKLELDLGSTDVIKLCDAALLMVRQQAQIKGIQMQSTMPTHLPLMMMDELRIKQLLINLLINAVKFTPEGGQISLIVDQQPSPDSTGTYPSGFLRITVHDTGIGIASQDFDRIFQPFIQVDSALNRQYEGTGLGLTLVKQIAELHGGKVLFTSEVAVGSSFTVELPWLTVPSSPGSISTAPEAGDIPG